VGATEVFMGEEGGARARAVARVVKPGIDLYSASPELDRVLLTMHLVKQAARQFQNGQLGDTLPRRRQALSIVAVFPAGFPATPGAPMLPRGTPPRHRILHPAWGVAAPPYRERRRHGYTRLVLLHSVPSTLVTTLVILRPTARNTGTH
jgi:hypothetical protein